MSQRDVTENSTVSELFHLKFYPNRLKSRANPKTVRSYFESVAHWVATTGDPALKNITDDTASDFTNGLAEKKGKRGPKMMKSSQNKHIVNMKSILKMALPRGACEYGLNLIPWMPYFPMPKQDKNKPNKNFLIDELHAMFRAAEVATYPNLPGVSPVDWWRSALVFDFLTGLRINTLVNIEYDMIMGNWLDIPPEHCKGGNSIRQYVHPRAMEYIDRIRQPGRSKIFGWDGWDKKRRYAYVQLRKIQAAAGIRENRRHAFHSIRSAHCTEIVRHSMDQQAGVKAAQDSAGHHSSDVTVSHYLGGDMMDDAKVIVIHRLPDPVPPEFRGQVVELAKPVPTLDPPVYIPPRFHSAESFID